MSAKSLDRTEINRLALNAYVLLWRFRWVVLGLLVTVISIFISGRHLH